MSNTIETSDIEACIEFVKTFVTNENVLVSGYAYVFSLGCSGDTIKNLQCEWEKTYQGVKQRNLYSYLSDKNNKRLRYVATGLAGYVNDETSLELLHENTRDEYDQVRIYARSALALRAFTDTTKCEK